MSCTDLFVLSGHGKQADQHGNDVEGRKRTARKTVYSSHTTGHEVFISQLFSKFLIFFYLKKRNSTLTVNVFVKVENV